VRIENQPRGAKFANTGPVPKARQWVKGSDLRAAKLEVALSGGKFKTTSFILRIFVG
jgi:hypothetical protein